MQDSHSIEQAKSFFLSGLAKLNGNNFAGAEIDFETSLKLVPNRLSTLINLSIALIKLKKFENAEKLINEGLLHHPKNKELLLGLVEIYEILISHKPDYAEAHVNLGNVYRELKKYDESLTEYNTAIILNPNLAEFYSNRGNVLQDLKKYHQALEDYDKAIAIKPEYAECYSNKGNTLKKIKKYEESLSCFNLAINIMADYAEAYSDRGIVFYELKRFDLALVDYDKAITLKSNFAEAHMNRGNALKELMRFDDALNAYERAITFNPNYVEAYSNRGVALQELKRIDEAINCFDKAISLEPEYAEASLNKSLILLLKGEFKKGWDLYKWRWNINSRSFDKFNTQIPHWDRINIDKSLKIFFWAEQGLGDEIFYFGILKNYFKIYSTVIISADNRLHGVFKRSMPEVEFIDRKKIDTEFIENTIDFQAPMGDLGYLCSVDNGINIHQHKPFLRVNKFCNDDIKIKVHTLTGKILCGLSWKSSNKDFGLSKSLNLIVLAPLLLIENLEFVSLQYGSTKDEIEFIEKSIGKKIHMVDGLDLYNDIDGLVALIDRCDFVVTTSNITAHLTGSIGKKGIVLLPFSKGKIWYWHSGIGQSLWYPSLELVSQIHMNDWTDPIQKCKKWILDQIKRK
jgi:tetratricopeptide (TPR) repeat protein